VVFVKRKKSIVNALYNGCKIHFWGYT